VVSKWGFEKHNPSRNVFLILNTLFMVVIAVLMLIPLFKVLSDSFDGLGVYGMNLLPRKFTTAAYEAIISSKELYRPFLISLYVTTVGSVIALSVTTLAGYALTEKRLPGRTLMIYLILITMVFNGGLIPTFMQIRRLGLINHLWAVILPLCIQSYYLILIKNFFSEIPMSFRESAEMDGASPFRIFWSIMIPLSKPALAAIGLFYIVLYWNDFFHFVIYINRTELLNFQVKLREMVLTDEYVPNPDVFVFPKSLQNAAVIVTIVPVMIVYPILQKHFVTGLRLGGIKG
jgi:putative aldouronate transport system permease protein